ncbi:hypothetical protein AAG742_08515 [Micrococcus sp. 2A]|uniref:hypothetical protein n=1 Tax=unclassified Micrococcus TaxID=2620948 RepID=UPI0029B24247|nr:hypothetical protein [Micrococcus sp. M4NT]MDX2340272.1 hypothetical protein [Micrococcus sp. M4NT]
MSETPLTSDPSAPQPAAAPQPSALDREMLEDYLNQHLLGSRPGVPAFRAAADTWEGTPQHAVLARLADGVEASQERLEEIIARLGFRTPVRDRAAGAVAAAGGRLNPVNAVRAKGSGWTQVELDVLTGALQGQSEMWRILERLAPHVPGLDAEEARGLLEQTREYLAEVQRVTDETLLRRFLG